MHVECGSRDAALRVFTSAGTLAAEKQPQKIPEMAMVFDDSSVVDIGLMKIASLM